MTLLALLVPGPKYFLFSGLPLINRADIVALVFLILLFLSFTMMPFQGNRSSRMIRWSMVCLASVTLLKLFSFLFLNAYYKGSYDYWPLLRERDWTHVCEVGTRDCFRNPVPKKDSLHQILGGEPHLLTSDSRLNSIPSIRPAFSPDNILSFPRYTRRDASIDFHATPHFDFLRWGYGSWRLGFFNTFEYGWSPSTPGNRIRTKAPFVASWEVWPEGEEIRIQFQGMLLLSQWDRILWEGESGENEQVLSLSEGRDFEAGKPLKITYGYEKGIFTSDDEWKFFYSNESEIFAPFLKMEGIRPGMGPAPWLKWMLNGIYSIVFLFVMGLLVTIYWVRRDFLQTLKSPRGIVWCITFLAMMVGLLVCRVNEVLIWKGGADAIMYDHYASQVLSLGSLEAGEKYFRVNPPGNRYAFALIHLIFGDSHSWIAILFGLFTYLFGQMIFLASRPFSRSFLPLLIIGFLLYGYQTSFLYFDGRNESTASFLIVAGLFFALTRKGDVVSVFSGLLLGLATTIRPDNLPCILAVTGFIGLHGKKSGRELALMVVPMLMATTLPLIHNLYYGHTWVWSSTVAWDSNLQLPPKVFFKGIFSLDGDILLMVGKRILKALSWTPFMRVPWETVSHLFSGVFFLLNIGLLALLLTARSPRRYPDILLVCLMFSPILFWKTGGRFTYAYFLLVYFLFCYRLCRRLSAAKLTAA
ncbi:MAG: hypothetical protein HYW02_08195 [Deltaproteobacteria bacterium]|nr:hypothetical protein [Deltaproteobacteria bacterium]